MVHIACQNSLVNNYYTLSTICVDNGLGQWELQETAFLFGQILIMIMRMMMIVYMSQIFSMSFSGTKGKIYKYRINYIENLNNTLYDHMGISVQTYPPYMINNIIK